MIHRRSPPAVVPYSSPRTASSGCAVASRSRIAASTARSASLTGVQVGLRLDVQVVRAEARHGDRVRGVAQLERELEVFRHAANVAECSGRLARACTSMTVAEPMPPPAHMLATPMPPPRRRSSYMSVVTIRAPVRRDRVAERAAAPVHVHDLVVEAEDPARRDRHRRERLVDLDEVDVAGGQPGAVERLRDRERRPEAGVGRRQRRPTPTTARSRAARARGRPRTVAREDHGAGARR